MTAQSAVRGRKRNGATAGIAILGLSVALLVGCGGDSGGPVSLKWFIAIQPGGSIQKVAEDCSKESGGKYDIELELLPTHAVESFVVPQPRHPVQVARVRALSRVNGEPVVAWACRSPAEPEWA